MIPRWLLVTIVLTSMAVFAGDFLAQFLITGHQTNPALTTVFGAIAGSAFLLARGDKPAGGPSRLGEALRKLVEPEKGDDPE